MSPSATAVENLRQKTIVVTGRFFFVLLTTTGDGFVFASFIGCTEKRRSRKREGGDQTIYSAVSRFAFDVRSQSTKRIRREKSEKMKIVRKKTNLKEKYAFHADERPS